MEHKKIAIYVRVSTEEQARTGYGLSDQERQCRKYLEIFFEDRQDDIELYKDDGYSAKDFNRPEIKRLIKEIEQKKVDTVIVFKLDRLTRSVIDVYTFISKIMELDCKLIAVLDHLDIHSANGRMFIGILSIIAQWEREVISERTLAGLEEMVAEGKYPYGGKRPFGWIINEQRYMDINPKEADILRWMAEQCIQNQSVNEIKEKLFEEKGIKMSWLTIKRLLTRKINIGIFFYHGKEYTDVIPPILDVDSYSKICEILDENKISRVNKTDYIFHRLVYCDCGYKMQQKSTYKASKEGTVIYYYYYCPRCNARVSQDVLFDELKDKILLLNNSTNHNENIKKIKSKLYKMEYKKKELYEEYKNDMILKEAYTYSINKIQSTENSLLKELSTLEKKLEDLSELTNEELYKIAHKIIDKIIIEPKNKKIKNILYKISKKT